MKHAASISNEEGEEENRRATKYPFMGEDEGTFSLIDPFKKFGLYIFMQIMRFFSYLTPSNLKKQINNMKEKTIFELIIGSFKLIFNMCIFSSSFIYSIVRYCLNIILRLMKGEALAGSSPMKQEQESNDNKEKLALQYVPPLASTTMPTNGTQDQATPTVKVTPANDQSTNKSLDADTTDKGNEGQTDEKRASIANNLEAKKLSAENKNDVKSSSKSCLTAEESKKEEIKLSSPKVSSQQAAVSVYEDETSSEIKDEQAQPALKSFSINFRGHLNRLVCWLARNFYICKNIALIIAFFINLILLCYKISTDVKRGDLDGSGELVGDFLQNLTKSGELNNLEALAAEAISAEDFDSSAEGSEEDTSLEIVTMPDYWYLGHLLKTFAYLHTLLAFCLLIGYYHLKLPLVIFKKEKEISRAVEFDGLYITEQNVEEFRKKWDKIVISTPSFPALYWDKFVKKRVREAYADQVDYETISKLLGMTNESFNDKKSNENLPLWRKIINLDDFDFKYMLWKAGVTISDQDFLYNLLYLIFSILGHLNFFFFAAHLLDIAFVVKPLRTILQSVTHNGHQLCLTVLLLVIVVYIYTVIAFNFFRKFYVQSEDGDDEENGSGEDDNELDDFQNKKCHSMGTCFLFNLYQGKLLNFFYYLKF